jgi:hypothetical protein
MQLEFRCADGSVAVVECHERDRLGGVLTRAFPTQTASGHRITAVRAGRRLDVSRRIVDENLRNKDVVMVQIAPVEPSHPNRVPTGQLASLALPVAVSSVFLIVFAFLTQTWPELFNFHSKFLLILMIVLIFVGVVLFQVPPES